MNNTNGDGQIRNVDGKNIPLLNFVYVIMSVKVNIIVQKRKKVFDPYFLITLIYFLAKINKIKKHTHIAVCCNNSIPLITLKLKNK